MPEGTPRAPDRQESPQQPPPAPRISLALSAEQARAVATGSAGGSSAVLPASQDCAAPGRSGPVVHLAVRDAADEAGDLLGVQVLGVFEREDDARMVRGAERVETHRLHTGAYAELGEGWRAVAVYDEHGALDDGEPSGHSEQGRTQKEAPVPAGEREGLEMEW